MSVVMNHVESFSRAACANLALDVMNVNHIFFSSPRSESIDCTQCIANVQYGVKDFLPIAQ
jgi:Na+-transporting NADH:ubiquinone oxidoreductase subunit NqrF